jgi:hypothetical protein
MGASSTSAADARVFAKGLRAALSSSTSLGALLQCRVSRAGAGVVRVESATEVPGHASGYGKAEGPEPALPGARPEQERTDRRSRGRVGEGHQP